VSTILNRHYGLSGHPFQGSIAAPALYLSRTHREALAALQWGLQEPSGYTLLTGEAGTGKTTLIYTLLARSHPNVHVVHLSNPKLSFREMLALILAELNIKSRLSRLAMHEALDRALSTFAPARRLALIVDEAQALSDETLDELRLLSNLPAAATKPLQMLLVGQPELVERLRRPELRQLNSRIGARAQLQRLDRAEIYEYIDCRLLAVGGRSQAIFTPRALRRLALHSRGLPRRINVLSHNAMLLAYVANKRRVDGRMVETAVRDYDGWMDGRGGPAFGPATWWNKSTPYAAALLLGLVLWQVAPRAYHLWNDKPPPQAATVPPTRAVARSAKPAAQPADKDTANPARDTTASLPERSMTARSASSIPAEPTGGGTAHAAGGSAIGDESAHHWAGGAPPAVAPPLTPARPERGPRLVITIRSGDTVADLAARYLGSSTHDTLTRVARANPQIRNINLIYPGETVLLPAGEPSR
jgi:general secretion pathway protein A